MSWLGRLLRLRRLERDLARELQFHVDARTDDLVRSGLSREEASRRARVELGGVEQVKEAARDARGTRWIEDSWQDARYAFRVMVRSPVFTSAAVLTLALGIGANTAVWSIVDALMLRSLPIERPEELFAVRRDGIDAEVYIISHSTMLRLRAELPASVPLAAMSSSPRMYATIDQTPESVVGQLVSGNWFATLGVRAIQGRLIGEADDRTMGAHAVAVISDGFWQSRFGGDPSVVGRKIRLNGVPITIIGVSQPGFSGLTVGVSVDVWVPVMMQHEVRYRSNVASENNSDVEKPWISQSDVTWLTLVARVAPGASRQIAARMDPPFRAALAETFASRDSTARAYGMREHIVLDPIPRGFSPLRRQFGEPLRVLLASVGLILLIACGNLAGLLLARSTARSREIAVRVSLGASPGRLIRQILTESILLAAIGGVLSLAVARWGRSALLVLASTSTQAVPLAVKLDARVLGFAFAVSIATGIVFGLAPAVRVARTDLYDSFKAGGRVSARASHRLPLGRALVTSQLALSLVLVTSAALFVKTFRNLVDIDPGYDRERVLEARLDVRAAGYAYDQLPGLYQRLLEAVRAVPGVRTVSLSLHGLAGGVRRTGGFMVPDRTLPPGTNSGQENYVTPDYFNTVGIPLLSGRGFTEADRGGTPRVVIVSRAFARHFFGRDDVLGARVGYGTPPEFTVIGVARDARVNSLREDANRMVFHPLAQGPREYVNSLEARITGPPEAMIPAVRRAIASVDRSLPVREVVTLGTLLERGLTTERLVARLAGLFATLALVLAGVGLYGVLSYSVSRRTSEIGVRLALGASPAGVTWDVLRDSLATLATGLAVGAALWFPILGATERLVYGVSPHDPVTLAAAAALLFLVGAVAGLVPALRASRIDPIRAIRAE